MEGNVFGDSGSFNPLFDRTVYPRRVRKSGKNQKFTLFWLSTEIICLL